MTTYTYILRIFREKNMCISYVPFFYAWLAGTNSVYSYEVLFAF